MVFQVPVVDISPYVVGGTDSERAAVARALDAACREVGFIQITGHGVPEEVIAGLASALDDFFALPLEVKKGYVTPPEVNRGYTAPKTESLSLSLGVESANRMNDFFEAFNIGDAMSDHPDAGLPEEHYPENVWPDADAPDFAERVTRYYREASRVARTMVRAFCDALELPEGFFDAYTSHSIDVLRMNNYALPAGTDVTLDGDLTGMGEHTDFGIVTILWADQVAGLQVLGTDGGWHDVMPIDGALLINLGDLTGRWTNDRWMSTLHRVKPPIVDGTIERRRSAAFFHDGNWDAVVSTLPGCVDAEHPDRYDPVTIDEHITAKLAGSRAGVKNTRTGSETARVLAAVSEAASRPS
ncbi:isopenicillin N synthase family oxygenase [Homoserinibacter sp. GY 40078]|uniref:isopenicillin N synthase family dioxygenase n=1 Tax=Homoserinibacter sp. GY 40078 TaxID=2603275 RepID=UPI0011CCAEFB|nr:2-oxoglutarate and iron-dependent oxygenase domain-containing protein [Homoserinibacter sp. GY 40078]TXK17431.1 isopenicillin N synthase family oxygenase [Homoserinibacter sp. GY 40078]